LGVFYPQTAHLFYFQRLSLHSWSFRFIQVFSQPGGGASQFAGGRPVPTTLLISTAVSSAA
jgi:hypothetical protein